MSIAKFQRFSKNPIVLVNHNRAIMRYQTLNESQQDSAWSQEALFVLTSRKKTLKRFLSLNNP